MRSKIKQISFFISLAGLILLSSCKKNEDFIPNDGKIAYINFYHAAEALLQNNGISGFRLQIDDAFPGGLQPEYQGSNGSFQYPSTVTGSNLAVDYLSVPSDVTYNVVYWLPVSADKYQFKYNSISYNSATQTTSQLGTIAKLNAEINANTFVTQYFTESLESDTSFKILNVPVERTGTPGKVRIQVVNLSPDLGPIEVYREDSNGAKITEGLPASVTSGAFSPYAEIDTAGAYKNLGRLLVKIRKSGSTNVLMTASIPATSKSLFTLVVQGFASSTIRRIKSTQATGFTQVTVSPNLRFNLRRIY